MTLLSWLEDLETEVEAKENGTAYTRGYLDAVRYIKEEVEERMEGVE